MPTDKSRERYSGIVIPIHEDVLEVWEEESSYTQAGPRPGVPVEQQRSQMALQASGTQGASREILVQTQRGGFPGTDDATFVWRNEVDAADAWNGWDPPQAQQGFEAAIWTDGGGTFTTKYVRDAHAVVLSNGTILVAAEIRDTAYSGTTGEYRVEVLVRSPSTGSYSRTLVYGTNSSPTQRWLPCLVVLPSGRVLLYHTLVDTASNRLNLRMWYSDDNGGSWSFGGDGVLDTDISVAGGSTDYVPKRIRAAYKNGQILLIVHATYGDTGGTVRDRLYQFASADLGSSFEGILTPWVPTADGAARPEVLAVADGFLLVYVGSTGTTNANARRLSHAFRSLDTATEIPLNVQGPTTTTSTFAITAADLCAVVDEHGKVWVFYRQVSSGECLLSTSSDNGETWDMVGRSIAYGADGGYWFYSGDSATYPTNLTAVPQRGRVLVFANWGANPGDEDDSLGVWYLGGYSTVSMPTITRTPDDRERVGWEHNWVPIELPEDCGWTASGAGTMALVSPGVGRMALAAGTTRFYSRTPNGTIAEGMIVRLVLKTTGGDFSTNRVSALLRLGDSAANSYAVEVRVQGSAWRLYDASSGALIGEATVSATQGVEILVAMSTGKVRTWSRVRSLIASRTWTVGPTTSTLTNGGGAVGNLIEWGVRVAGSVVTVDWYEVCDVTNDYVGQGLHNGQSNPTELYGRAYSSSPVYVDDGVRIQASGGPTVVGEQWSIATRYDYELRRALDVGSPRITHRTTSTAEQVYAFRWNENSGSDAWLQGGLLSISGFNANWSVIVVDFWDEDTTSWVNPQTIELFDGFGYDLEFVRNGNSVRPHPTNVSGHTPYLKAGEFAGDTFVNDDTGFRILDHSEGAWKPSTTTRLRPTIILRDIDGGVVTSGLGAIIPGNWVVLLDLAGTPYSGVRITVPTPSSTVPVPAEAYWEIGTLVLGHALVFGQDYDWGRAVDLEAGNELSESRDGVTRSRSGAPPKQTVEIAFMEGAIDQTQAEGDDADPDFVFASEDVGAEPDASPAGTAYALEAMFRRLDGSHRWCVYLARFEKADGPRVLNRRSESMLARVTSALRRETSVGDENRDEVVRVAQLVLEQVR